MRARTLLLLLLFLLLARSTRAQDVRIGVLGVFHPRHLTLSCTGGEALVVATADKTIFLQPRSSRESLQIRTDGDTLLLSVNGREIHANEFKPPAGITVQQDSGLASQEKFVGSTWAHWM